MKRNRKYRRNQIAQRSHRVNQSFSKVKIYPRAARSNIVNKATATIYQAARKLVNPAVRKKRAIKYLDRLIVDPIRAVDHRCRTEYSKVLSWRKSRSGAGAKRDRTQKELKNNFNQFKKHDC
jgi:hypothetical protein